MRAAHALPFALAALLLAACGDDDDTAASAEEPPTDEAAASTVDVKGTVQLRPDEDIIGVGGLYQPGAECDGLSTGGQDLRYFSTGMDEFVAGAQVVVANGSGDTIAVGELEPGRWLALPTDTNLSEHVCAMDYRITDVPADAIEFFEVAVAGESVTVPAEEITGFVDIVVEDR